MITQAICTSFLTELYSAEHNILGGDTIMIALYTSDASLGASATAYTATEEISGSGYSAGGIALSGADLALSDGVLTLTFDDATFTGAVITGARGALLYNSSNSDKAIAVLNFGSDKIGTVAAPLTVSFP